MKKKKIYCLSMLSLLILVNSVGCGLISNFGANVTEKVISRYSEKLDDKLKVKYGILPEDDAATIAKKMFAVEGKTNPDLATQLLSVGPEAWDELSDAFDKNGSLMGKITAGLSTIEKVTGALNASRDENGNIMWWSSGGGSTLLLLIFALVNRWRKDKKAKADLIKGIENPINGSVKEAVALKNNTDLNNFITSIFPKKKKDAA